MAFATINQSGINKNTTPSSNPAIEEAFAAEPSLKSRIYDAIGKCGPENKRRSKKKIRRKRLTMKLLRYRSHPATYTTFRRHC